MHPSPLRIVMATYGSSMAHNLTDRWPAASEDDDKLDAAACKSHVITLSFTDPGTTRTRGMCWCTWACCGLASKRTREHSC